MGEQELREALRSKAQERIRDAWQAAEAAVAARRDEVAAQCEQLRAAMEEQLAATVAATRQVVLLAAQREGRQLLLAAEDELQRRLYDQARSLLPALGADHRRGCWQSLVVELPAGEWRRVTVHPDDLTVARETFPQAEVIAEAALGGGVQVETGDDRVLADNSLAGRLERSWSELLVPLFAEISRKIESDAAGAATPD
jgi:vacuolar-type H+-ATPase subunit E/Vma4